MNQAGARMPYQVADKNAGGVHFVQAFRDPKSLTECRRLVRERLQRLDQEHPELAQDARKAGMRTIGDLELYPDPENGFRLFLCRGRTMLLDKPLPPVFNKRMQKWVPDVVEYISWILKPEAYMPKDEVFAYVRERLRGSRPESVNIEKRRTGSQRREPSGNGMGSLGKMKGRYAEVLVEFWTGTNPVADTLNKGIRLLALMLPYYLPDQDEAVDLIEKYIDELPDHSFSDRLAGNNRAEVSRIIQGTVEKVYDGNGGQPDPDQSKAKLSKTFQAWNKTGFNPTDKATWNRAKAGSRVELDEDFSWNAAEVRLLPEIQQILKADLETTSKATKYLLRLIKVHPGEVSINFVKKILSGCGIQCRGNHGKANRLLQLLRDWNWIYMRHGELWYHRNEDGTQPAGRARAYGIGEELAEKFEISSGSAPKLLPPPNKHLSIASPSIPASKRIERERRLERLFEGIYCSRGSPITV